jgi:menaquinone-dependent protoporphyrinogen oxidase
MSSKVLVAFATMYGSTREVAEAIAGVLRECGVDADVMPAGDVRELGGYDAVVVGAPLVTHHLHKDATRLLSRNRKALEQMPVALFTLGPVHVPYDEEEWQDSRKQLDQELAKLPWFEPVAVEILGGRFDPALLRFPLNKLAGSEPASDIRDWDAIRAWAEGLPSVLGTSA